MANVWKNWFSEKDEKKRPGQRVIYRSLTKSQGVFEGGEGDLEFEEGNSLNDSIVEQPVFFQNEDGEGEKGVKEGDEGKEEGDRREEKEGGEREEEKEGNGEQQEGERKGEEEREGGEFPAIADIEVYYPLDESQDQQKGMEEEGEAQEEEEEESMERKRKRTDWSLVKVPEHRKDALDGGAMGLGREREVIRERNQGGGGRLKRARERENQERKAVSRGKQQKKGKKDKGAKGKFGSSLKVFFLFL